MKTLARISVILFLLLSLAPGLQIEAARATVDKTAPPTLAAALPPVAQAAGATSSWWAAVQAHIARSVPGADPQGLSPTPNWTQFGGQAGARMGRAATGAGKPAGAGSATPSAQSKI